MDRHLVEQCVENLCERGCREVWTIIEDLESGQSIPEVDGLSQREVEAVTKELRAVMAVYDGRCSVS